MALRSRLALLVGLCHPQMTAALGTALTVETLPLPRLLQRQDPQAPPPQAQLLPHQALLPQARPPPPQAVSVPCRVLAYDCIVTFYYGYFHRFCEFSNAVTSAQAVLAGVSSI